jgi:hypothetical protein
MLKTIGFDRYIQLDWLNAVANKLCQSSWDFDSIRGYMHDLLNTYHPNYEARRKTITVLTRIWLRVPSDAREVQLQAISLFDQVPESERIWLHWGMTMIAYPFFRDITSSIGKLLSLQRQPSIHQIHNLVENKWGQRTTVKRAVNRVIQSLREWNTIYNQHNTNTFTVPIKFTTNNKDLQRWLLEAILRSEGIDSMQMQRLLNSPSIFPFLINTSSLDFRSSNTLEYSKQAYNSEILAIRYQRLYT